MKQRKYLQIKSWYGRLALKTPYKILFVPMWILTVPLSVVLFDNSTQQPPAVSFFTCNYTSCRSLCHCCNGVAWRLLVTIKGDTHKTHARSQACPLHKGQVQEVCFSAQRRPLVRASLPSKSIKLPLLQLIVHFSVNKKRSLFYPSDFFTAGAIHFQLKLKMNKMMQKFLVGGKLKWHLNNSL